MSHKDYTRFSNQKVEPKTNTIQNGVPNVVTEEQPVVEAETVKPKIGKVVDCIKLNVRKEPSVNAEVVCELLAYTEVIINDKESTDVFYKICTAAGIEGYCMRQYIRVE